jgi:hypothetical protein
VGVIRSVLAAHCLVAFRVAVGQACCCMMSVFAALEEVRRNMIVEVCPANLVGIRVVLWRIGFVQSQLHSAYLFQEHHQREVASSLGEQLALAQWEQQGCMPWVQAVAVVAEVVKSQLRLIVPMPVVLGMSVSRRCSLLEDGSVLQSRSSPAAGPRDSSSHDARPGWLWTMQAHLGCPTSRMAQCSVDAPKKSRRLAPSTSKCRACACSRDTSARFVRRMCSSATRSGWELKLCPA